jgi:uncharacterized protein (DUF927 family)
MLRAAQDPKIEKHLSDCRNTLAKLRADSNAKVTGIPTLETVVGKKAIVKLTEWLSEVDDVGSNSHRLAKQARESRPTIGENAFQLTQGSLLYVDSNSDKEPLVICGRLEVAALTRSADGNGWGRLLKWADSEGQVHEWAMPMSLLAGDGNEYRARLLDGGLFIAPGKRARDLLTVYLQTTRTEARALCVTRIGWHGGTFVFPGETIGRSSAERVLFQTPHESEHLFNMAGTLDDWRANVGRFCRGNSRLIVAVSCAFAGPILALAGSESGGVNFRGRTSTGKTTALLVGGSVLGGGGRNGFVQSWRATVNGLEAVAELHNDLCLYLDELAQIDPSESAETAYLLANGSGKARMSRNIGARKKLTWRLMFVSAGEVTLADHALTAGKRTRGGAEVRLLNIEADAGAGMGLFENIHQAESPDAFSRQLKETAQRFYGTPLRTWLEWLTNNRAKAEQVITKFQADFPTESINSGASGEVYRAAQRFALIGAAGELATEAGITGWEPGESTKAVRACLESWIMQRGTIGHGDEEAAIAQVRHFIEAHGASRFQAVCSLNRFDSPDDGQIVRERAGFKRNDPDGTTEYLILPETFRREVCAGYDYRTVARALETRDYLERQSPALTKKIRLPEIGNIRVFCVRSSILES